MIRNEPSNTGSDTRRTELAQNFIVFLSAQPEELSRFLKISGVEPDELRALMGNVDFERGLVDYISQNEPLLMAFCEATGTDPSLVSRLQALR